MTDSEYRQYHIRSFAKAITIAIAAAAIIVFSIGLFIGGIYALCQ